MKPVIASVGRRITVDIARDGDGCVSTPTHEIAAGHAQYADRTEHGWTTIPASLARHLDNASPT
jgi:hypothetical protein